MDEYHRHPWFLNLVAKLLGLVETKTYRDLSASLSLNLPEFRRILEQQGRLE